MFFYEMIKDTTQYNFRNINSLLFSTIIRHDVLGKLQFKIN